TDDTHCPSALDIPNAVSPKARARKPHAPDVDSEKVIFFAASLTTLLHLTPLHRRFDDVFIHSHHFGPSGFTGSTARQFAACSPHSREAAVVPPRGAGVVEQVRRSGRSQRPFLHSCSSTHPHRRLFRRRARAAEPVTSA